LPSEFPLNVKLTEGGSVAGWIPFFVYAGDSAPLLTAQAEGGHTLFFAAQPAVTAVPAPTTTLISTSEALLSLPVTSDGWQFNYRGPIDTIEHIELPSAPIYPAVGRFVVVPVQIDFVGEGSQVLSLGYLVGPANTAVEIRLVDAVGNEYPYDWTLTSHYYSSTGVQFDRARIVDSRQVKTQVVDCIFDVPPEAVLERLDIYEGPMYQRPDQFVGSIRLP
jgi:hypothetical protein